MQKAKRRQILEALAGDERTSTADRLKALDLLDRLGEERAEDHPDFWIWRELCEMSDEALDAELEALGAPVTTAPSFEDNEVFEREVERRAALLANEQTVELRRERHELQKALKRAEARAEAARPAKPSKPASDAPSTPDKPQEDAGAVVADLLAARERLWPDGPPRKPFGRG